MSYAGPIAAAKRLIAAKGELCIWRQYIVSNGGEDWNETLDSIVDHNVPIVILPYNSSLMASISKLVGLSDIDEFKMYGLMSAVSFTPTTRDVVLSVRGELRPGKISPLQPATEVIMYTLGFKG